MNKSVNITAREGRDSLAPAFLAGGVSVSSLTHARLLRLFDYDAATGNLTWKVSETPRAKIGSVAGAVARNGRRYIGVDGERQMAHRLVWFWHKGEWPSENLAPVNGDYLDTRIENLIEQTAQETVAKGRLRSTNSSGVKGIWFDKARGKWAAQTVHNYRTKSHGRFDTLEEAETALAAAKSAENGVDLERQQLKRANSQQRRLWNRMLRGCHGKHDWPSVEAFITDVGSPPQPNFYVAPVDTTKSVGPDNFVWSAPQYDHRTRDGRMASSRSSKDEFPDRQRDKQLRRDHGIDGLREFNQKLAEQKGVCAICLQPETAFRKGKLLPLAVDHDHRTGTPRGLLCTACNIAIGALGDDCARIIRAATYVEHWREVHNKPLPDNVVPLKG